MSVLVWGVWALSLAAALAFVRAFGSNVPSWDGWDMVPTLTGEQPVSAAWLWSQHNEHRIPVPRLLMLGLHGLTGIDFRTPMVFDALGMGLLAAGLLVAARRLRGRTSVADAFLPLLFLNWGHGVNFVWGWQLEYFISTFLAGAVLLAVAGTRPDSRLAIPLFVGVCLLLLGMCGAHGVALLPALALWLGYAAWVSRREPAAWVVAGLAVAAWALAALYFVGYERVPYHPQSSGPRATLMTAVKFLTMGLGPAVRDVWPFSGVAVVTLFAATVVLLSWVLRGRPEERLRAAGLLCFLAALGSLALGLGLGRDGFEPRYISLAVPALACVYLVWVAYGPGRSAGWVGGALLGVALIGFVPNTRFGQAYGSELRGHLAAFERDMAAGMPPYRLILRHARHLHVHHDVLEDYLPMLKRAQVGSFRWLAENPAFREIPVPLLPSSSNDVRWEGGTAHALGDYPFVVFDLPSVGPVAGLRLAYSYRNEQGTAPYVSFYWKDRDQQGFTGDRFYKVSPTGDRANWERGTWTRLGDSATRLTLWLDAPVDQLRVHPDFQPGVFEIHELVVVVADEP